MARPLAFYLDQFPAHGILIGEILLSYSHLEFMVVDLVGQAIGRDIDCAIRLLYRLRGANDRLQAADAVLRPFMNDLALGGPYGQWLGAMRKCRIIRNQFAHCGWMSRSGHLEFASLEECAQGTEGETTMHFNRIELKLLEQQLDYFEYAYDVLIYLTYEARYRRDRRRRHRNPLPKSREAPSLHSPRD